MTLELRTVLPPEAASAKRARDLATSGCRRWGIADLAADVALVVTELVANAVRYAGTDIELRVVPIAQGVRLEVADGSTRPLLPRPAGLDAEGGRGLLLIDALSTTYGVEANPSGKRVWAELHLPG